MSANARFDVEWWKGTFKEGKSDKFYIAIKLRGTNAQGVERNLLITRYGRQGAFGKTEVKEYGHPDTLRHAYNKLYDEKRRKRYAIGSIKCSLELTSRGAVAKSDDKITIKNMMSKRDFDWVRDWLDGREGEFAKRAEDREHARVEEREKILAAQSSADGWGEYA